MRHQSLAALVAELARQTDAFETAARCLRAMDPVELAIPQRFFDGVDEATALRCDAAALPAAIRG
jgi:hypothetical protein